MLHAIPKWIKMRSELKSIHFNIRESKFLKIWINFNSFQSILVCWTCLIILEQIDIEYCWMF